MLGDPADDTRCALIYANKSPDDIWLKDELDAMAAAHPDRCAVPRLGPRAHAALGQRPRTAAARRAPAFACADNPGHYAFHHQPYHRFHVRYVLENPPPGWTGSTGRVRGHAHCGTAAHGPTRAGRMRHAGKRSTC